MIALLMMLAIWMLVAGSCGYRTRFLGFLGVLAIGLTLNEIWMVLVLDLQPLEHVVLMVQVATLSYALCAFGSGWLIGRLTRALRATRVEKNKDV